MNGKKWILCALFLSAVLLLSACAPKQESAAQKAQTGFVPALDKNAEGTVNVVGHYSNFEALEAEFNRFTAYYPNVKLSYTCLDNYNGIIVTALSSSEAPDIFFTYPWMLTREGYGAIFEAAEDLSDPKLKIDLGCIRESILTRNSAGSVWTVPIYTTTYGMLVNESIFEKEKIAVPTTYTELLSACEALKKAGYANPVMAHNSGGFLLLPLYYPSFCAKVRGSETAAADMNAFKEGAGENMRDALELAADFMSRGYLDLESCNQLENDYNAVIMRFFEGDVPMMLVSANTVSGTEKRESQSEAFTANPFRYSFRLVPGTDEGPLFVNTVSMGFAVNKNSKNLAFANEFMRFLVTTEEMNRIAQAKRMVPPCVDMSLDKVYGTLSQVSKDKIINLSELGLSEKADGQVRIAAWKVCNGEMTVDEAVAAYGSLQ